MSTGSRRCSTASSVSSSAGNKTRPFPEAAIANIRGNKYRLVVWINYEVLSRKRPLTLTMIRNLHRELGIPAESLIKQSAALHRG
jgi:hypothetical protein